MDTSPILPATDLRNNRESVGKKPATQMKRVHDAEADGYEVVEAEGYIVPPPTCDGYVVPPPCDGYVVSDG